MQKLTVGLISGTFALCLPQIVFGDSQPTSTPQRVLITYQVLEVPGNTGIPVSTSATAAGFYKSALQNVKNSEATEISVETPADVAGAVRNSRVLTFSVQDHGKTQQAFLDVPTSLEATPHINTDGTITVQLKTEVTRAAPTVADAGLVPLTNGSSWQSKQTFKNGETRMFGTLFEFTSTRGFVGNDPKTQAKNKEIIASLNKEFVQFVTVTVLPTAKTAQP